MAVVGGKLTNWEHGTNGATTTLTDFTAKTESVDASFDNAMLEANTFGTSSKKYLPGLKDGSISATYHYDTTIFGQLNAIYANQDAVSFEYSPDGTTSGKPKATGSMYMSSFSAPAEVDSVLTISVEWQVTDTVTFGTH